VTSSNQEVKDVIYSVTGNADILIDEVEYSYNDLEEIKDQVWSEILKYVNDNPELYTSTIGVYIDEINNNVAVEISECSFGRLLELSKIVSEISKATEIHVIDVTYKKAASVTAGYYNSVVNSSTGGWSTIGFCANRTNSSGVMERGFVIAGHTATMNTVMKIQGTAVGKVTWRAYNADLDAAFVSMNGYPSSGYTQSRNLSSGYQILGTSTVGVVGSTYEKHGAHTGITRGTVNSTSFSYTQGGVTWVNLIRMNISAQTGDSGAPLVSPASSTAGSRSVLGILEGVGGGYANFVKVNNILNAMNGRLY